MLIVAAVGGNALLRRGERSDADVQSHNASLAATVLAPLAHGNSLVITHGNGPQVGLLALESGSSWASARYPLDVVGAESQGMIGYLLELALRNQLRGRGVASILGQVLVDAEDPAFDNPTKPIGPFYSEAEAISLRKTNHWIMGSEGSQFRRLVPSPEPVEILELAAIRALLAANVVTISAGGGGVPVIRQDNGCLSGVEGVVDKDLTANLLARTLGADALLLLTDVAAVHERWGDPLSRTIRSATPATLRQMEFAPGSMGPKVNAACRFAEQTGQVAYIGALEQAPEILAVQAGTRVATDSGSLTFWEEAS